MSHRYHVWFFTVCYVLIGLIEPLVVSEAMRLPFLIYFYCVMTTGLAWYAVAAWRAHA